MRQRNPCPSVLKTEPPIYPCDNFSYNASLQVQGFLPSLLLLPHKSHVLSPHWHSLAHRWTISWLLPLQCSAATVTTRTFELFWLSLLAQRPSTVLFLGTFRRDSIECVTRYRDIGSLTSAPAARTSTVYAGDGRIGNQNNYAAGPFPANPLVRRQSTAVITQLFA